MMRTRKCLRNLSILFYASVCVLVFNSYEYTVNVGKCRREYTSAYNSTTEQQQDVFTGKLQVFSYNVMLDFGYRQILDYVYR